jgi:hypothetical protein
MVVASNGSDPQGRRGDGCEQSSPRTTCALGETMQSQYPFRIAKIPGPSVF